MEESIIGIVLQSVLVGGFFGLIVCGIVEGIILPLTRGKNNKSIVDDAIEQGHIVKAHLIRYYDGPNVENRKDSYTAEYEYQVDGKKYKRTYDFYRRPSSEITLYWKNNPANAHTEDVLEQKNKKIHLFVLGGILIVFFCKLLF